MRAICAHLLPETRGCNGSLGSYLEDPEDIREALRYLTEQRLVITRPTARYELAHDYLAEYFHQKSGSELDPTDRDNILYHFEGDSSEVNTFVSLKAEADEPRRGVFALAIIIPLVILMTVRLIDFGLGWLTPRNHVFQQLLWDNRFFDAAYLPIYITRSLGMGDLCGTVVQKAVFASYRGHR